jgi:DNA-binding response OmpR family regulator
MNKIRILVIDDEPHWVEFIKKDLDRFEITVAHDTESAVAELSTTQFDLVIASSRRLDVLRLIAEEHINKRVIVTTMQPTTQEALAVYRLGALRYIPKSFSPQELLDRVKDLIPVS